MFFKLFTVFLITICGLMIIFLIVAKLDNLINEKQEAKRNGKEKN